MKWLFAKSSIVEVRKRYGRNRREKRIEKLELKTLQYFYKCEISVNAVLVLINVACALLDHQVARLASDFEKEGGFTERLYNTRKAKRKDQSKWPERKQGAQL